MKLAIKMGRRKSNEIGDDLFTGGGFSRIKKSFVSRHVYDWIFGECGESVRQSLPVASPSSPLLSSPKSIDRPGEEESVDKRTSPQELTGLLFLISREGRIL
jgi:hypothetical protein